MRTIIGIVISVVLILAVLGQIRLPLTVGVQNAASDSAADVYPPSQQNPPPPVAQQPVQQPVQQPPPVSSGSWSCPGSPVANNGCLVTTTTDLIAGLCVDFDPGSSTIAGPHEDVKAVPGWTRSRITGQAAWTPTGSNATATIYKDASCPPFP